MSRTFRTTLVALSAAALITGGLVTPAQAQTTIEIPAPLFTTEMISSVFPQPIQDFLFLAFAFPVISTSILSSALGFPQCGLHDTRAC